MRKQLQRRVIGWSTNCNANRNSFVVRRLSPATTALLNQPTSNAAPLSGATPPERGVHAASALHRPTASNFPLLCSAAVPAASAGGVSPPDIDTRAINNSQRRKKEGQMGMKTETAEPVGEQPVSPPMEFGLWNLELSHPRNPLAINPCRAQSCPIVPPPICHLSLANYLSPAPVTDIFQPCLHAKPSASRFSRPFLCSSAMPRHQLPPWPFHPTPR